MLAQTRKTLGPVLGPWMVVPGARLSREANWAGSFYVSVQVGGKFDLRNRRSHRVAVVNGVIVDNLSKSWLRGRVQSAWEFERRLSYSAAVVHI